MTLEQLKNLSAYELMNKANEIKEHTIKLGAEWAELDKRYHDLKELMPSFLAEIQCSYTGLPPAQAKNRALASKHYQEKILEMTEAEKQARLLKVEYQANTELLKAISAVSYLRNTEIKLDRTGY